MPNRKQKANSPNLATQSPADLFGEEAPFDLPQAPPMSTAAAKADQAEAAKPRVVHGSDYAPDAANEQHAVPSPPARRSISERAMSVAAPPDYLEGLNPEQKRAVETLDGPVLVLAGAGTGKTRVLTTRIAHILATGRAYPSQVLSVTFTNKAAREMKHRIGTLVGGAVEGMPWLGTFHSIGVKILRRHHELAGLKSGFNSDA